MRQELDGTGGGFGKYRGITVKEAAVLFERFSADPTMRGVTGVLRVSREQLEARGTLGIYPYLALGVTILLAAVGAFVIWLPPDRRSEATKLVYATGFVAAALWVGVATTGSSRRRAVAQEQEIRRLAVAALHRIVLTPGFHSKRLDRQDRRTLRELLLKTRSKAPELMELIRDSE